MTTIDIHVKREIKKCTMMPCKPKYASIDPEYGIVCTYANAKGNCQYHREGDKLNYCTWFNPEDEVV